MWRGFVLFADDGFEVGYICSIEGSWAWRRMDDSAPSGWPLVMPPFDLESAKPFFEQMIAEYGA